MKRILVVEDDEDMVELLKIVFRDSGCEVIFSKVAPETDYIQLIHPDLILLDVRLNGSLKSGVDICRELKSTADTKNLPVILVSGEYNLPELARECKADMYLRKPYELGDLVYQINQFL